MDLMNYTLLLILFNMSARVSFQNTLLGRKSMAMEMVENGERLPPTRSSSTGADSSGVHLSVPVYETANLDYIQKIGIGTPRQEFWVWVNLQHYDLVVPNLNCSTPLCQKLRKFSANSSSTFRGSSNYTEIYLSDLEAKGYYGGDVLELNDYYKNNVSIADMRFLLVHYLISYSAVKTEFDGILGLQPSYSNSSFIDNLLKKGFVDNPLLTIWLSNRNISTEEPAGTITYGAIDAEHCSSEASVYTKMFTVYLIESNGFGLGNYSMAVRREMEFTMEIWIRMEEEHAESIAEIVGATYDEAANMYNVSCDAKFADFEIYIGNATLRIPSEQLILEMDDGRCVFAITRYEEELGGEPIYIGAPLYRQYCTVFDIRNQQIGFTAAVPTTPAPPTTSPVPSKPATSSPMASSSTTLKQTSSLVTTEPTTSSPTTSKPTASSPTTSKPATSSPTSSKPTASSPTTSKPTTSSPTTSKPTASSPATSKSTKSSPTTSKPTASSPTSSKPTTSSPTASKPTASSPTTSKPATSSPTTSKPTTSSPTTSKPTASSPTTSKPATSSSTSSKPATSSPTTSKPATSSPTTTRKPSASSPVASELTTRFTLPTTSTLLPTKDTTTPSRWDLDSTTSLQQAAGGGFSVTNFLLSFVLSVILLLISLIIIAVLRFRS